MYEINSFNVLSYGRPEIFPSNNQRGVREKEMMERERVRERN
jgi:hypothetical protein